MVLLVLPKHFVFKTGKSSFQTAFEKMNFFLLVAFSLIAYLLLAYFWSLIVEKMAQKNAHFRYIQKKKETGQKRFGKSNGIGLDNKNRNVEADN